MEEDFGCELVPRAALSGSCGPKSRTYTLLVQACGRPPGDVAAPPRHLRPRVLKKRRPGSRLLRRLRE